MRTRVVALSALSLLPLLGCSSSYHPEYHPVTVSHFSQNVSYPVSVGSADPVVTRAPVYVVPAPASPVPAYPVDAPPPDFFR
jgi:hypothetical protein